MATQRPHEDSDTGNDGPFPSQGLLLLCFLAALRTWRCLPPQGYPSFSMKSTLHTTPSLVTPPGVSQLNLHFLFSKALFTVGGRAAETTMCSFEAGLTSKLEPLQEKKGTLKSGTGTFKPEFLLRYDSCQWQGLPRKTLRNTWLQSSHKTQQCCSSCCHLTFTLSLC